MAYDFALADRIRKSLYSKHVIFEEVAMMGGLCFKVDDKMLCGILIDKKLDENLLMARIGVENYEKYIDYENVLPMDFTGRPMKGYIFITPPAMDTEQKLSDWLDLCLAYNPLAKKSNKKSK